MSTDLNDLLDRSFHDEPSHPTIGDDLTRGRRALRRHRARTGAAALGVVAASGLVAVLVPALTASQDEGSPGFATGGLSDAALANACVQTDNIASWVRGRGMSEARMAEVMGQAQVMTRADSGQEVLATVRSEDGRFWGECFVPYGDRASYKHGLSVFRTDVTFASTDVDGVRVYRPQDEADPRFWGSDGLPAPRLSVPCVLDMAEETAEYREGMAGCRDFTVTWVDRRPAEVAGVLVHNPDGTVGHADVRDGYVSYAYRAPMTPAVAQRFRSGDTNMTAALTFLDADGDVLAEGSLDARQANPDNWPESASEGTPSVMNYPTLAWWLRQDG